MALWDFIKGLFDRDRVQLIEYAVPPDAVSPKVTPVVAQADVHYFRLKLTEMFLGKQVAWFQSLYPAVHSLVRCNFGGQSVEIPCVADLTRLGIQPSGGQGDMVARNFVLSPTLPFNGGTLAVTAGLTALTGENYLARFLKTLGNFASLLTIPQLSSALAVATPLAEGVQDLFGAGNGRLHLGYLNTFEAPNLQSGYIAVVRATANHLDPKSLCLQDGHLCRRAAAGDPQPLTGFDYMLFEIQVFAERDDWHLPSIETPLQDALRKLATGDTQTAKELLNQAILAALTARELTEAHRWIVIEQLKNKFKAASQQLEQRGLSAQITAVSLAELMKTAPPPESMAGRGRISLRDALQGLL